MQLFDSMATNSRGAGIKSETELLLFTLFNCRQGLIYDVLGLVCGMDAATAKPRQDERSAVLREALRLAACLPEQEFQPPAELQRYFSKRRAVLLDAEFATQRPHARTHARTHDAELRAVVAGIFRPMLHIEVALTLERPPLPTAAWAR